MLSILLAAAFLAEKVPRLREQISADSGAPSRFNQPLESLRGYLAASVFLSHAYITFFVLNGSSWTLPNDRLFAHLGPDAVTAFFFITGYVFWRKIPRLSDQQALASFYKRRIARLMPAYLMILFMLLVTVAYRTQLTLKEPLTVVLLEILQWITIGIPHFSDINNLTNTAEMTANVFWTLRVEWLFYLAMPLMGWFLTRRRVAFLLVILLALATSPLYPWRHIIGDSLVASILDSALFACRELATFTLGGFGLGMMAGALVQRFPIGRQLKRQPYAIFSFAALIAIIVLFPPELNPWKSVALLIALLPVFYGNDLLGLLSHRSSHVLGAVSYSLYLVHGLVLFWITRALAEANVGWLIIPWHYCMVTLVVVIIAMAMSVWLYRNFEYPYLSARQPYARLDQDIQLR